MSRGPNPEPDQDDFAQRMEDLRRSLEAAWPLLEQSFAKVTRGAWESGEYFGQAMLQTLAV